ncbi:MAG: hypothetical protein H6970_16060 [Gammaproteobacteria bacterium]|nr:hypothetical protein [Gammaproteobacteria bacterium]MCP5458734.1 hypothetical protein [Gammaproteobacteria bacterium]MCP5460081.1 hypothetical protein [Gammaproteobacteria bacterium]
MRKIDSLIPRSRAALTVFLLSAGVIGQAAPPLATGDFAPALGNTAPARETPTVTPSAPIVASEDEQAGEEPGLNDPAWAEMEAAYQALRASVDLQPLNDTEPLNCPPELHNLDNMVCLTDAEWDVVVNSTGPWELQVNEDGAHVLIHPPVYDPFAAEWTWDDSTEPCNPNIDVVLKQAALAGSQMTRKISDTQLSYPQTDPIIAVNNPQTDGYGGVCTINIFVFQEIWKMIGESYEQIKDLIEALQNFSIDSLFGAGCSIIHSIFGDLQNQLLQDIENHSPLTQLEQLIAQLQIGFIAPLNTLTSLNLSLHISQATLPGVQTAEPLLVTYILEVGYVYFVQLSNNNLMVIRVNATPLVPEDGTSQ